MMGIPMRWPMDGAAKQLRPKPERKIAFSAHASIACTGWALPPRSCERVSLRTNQWRVLHVELR